VENLDPMLEEPELDAADEELTRARYRPLYTPFTPQMRSSGPARVPVRRDPAASQEEGYRVKRHLATLLGVGAAAGALALPAAADPGHAKNAAHVQATCGTQTVNVVVNGNGKFTPAHVVGSTKMFIPTALNLTFTFTPTNGMPTSDTQNVKKAGPAHRGTVSCTIPMQTLQSGPQGTATIQGSVTGFFTPVKHA
jgi:hypothetical protein